MLLAVGIDASREAAKARLEQAVSSGAALEKLRLMIEAQGGNPAVVDDPGALPQARHSEVWEAPRDGLVTEVVPRDIGRAINAMGGGRQRVSDHIDPSVGFHITVKPGHVVRRGQPLATIHAREEHGLAVGRRALEGAVRFGEIAEPAPARITSRHRGWRGGHSREHQLARGTGCSLASPWCSGWCSAGAGIASPAAPSSIARSWSRRSGRCRPWEHRIACRSMSVTTGAQAPRARRSGCDTTETAGNPRQIAAVVAGNDDG